MIAFATVAWRQKNIYTEYGREKDAIAGECSQGAEAGRGVPAAAVS